MARRSIHRLSDRTVKATKRPGMYCDGGGLYLQVTIGADGKTARKSWSFRFATGEIKTSRNGKPRQVEREMGLGSFPDTSLADARARAMDARNQREQGIDPIEARCDQRAAVALAQAKAMTFDQCRDAYIGAHRAAWRNAKHAGQWTRTLDTYVTKVFGRLPVQTVDVALVMRALEPLWATKPETAGRVRGRIEAVLDWAKARGYRAGENPARWRGHLDKLLPARSKVRKVQHHAALPYSEIGQFLAHLREREGTAARALEFAIATVARTSETIGLRWSEVDRRDKVWTVPGDRMKSGREHRVPLNDAAMAVLERMGEARENDYVFPGERRAALSNMAMLKLLERMGRDDLTVHGFRSTFRDWTAERTNFPSEVAEAALAHVVGGDTERAYRRGDMFDKRRRLMAAWAEFLSKAEVRGTVVQLRVNA
jgi:integrase